MGSWMDDIPLGERQVRRRIGHGKIPGITLGKCVKGKCDYCHIYARGRGAQLEQLYLDSIDFIESYHAFYFEEFEDQIKEEGIMNPSLPRSHNLKYLDAMRTFLENHP